jgi:hypothetical protein
MSYACKYETELILRLREALMISKLQLSLRLLHTMNVRFSLLDIAQRILGVTLPNFQ